VVDFALFDFHRLFKERHLRSRDEDVMVAYLLEITPARTRREAESLWHDPTV
jgi:hypothetical protein